MDLPHARKDDLFGLGIPIQANGRVFFHKTAQRGKDLVLFSLIFGFNGIRNDRGGRRGKRKEDRVFLVCQGIPGHGFFQFSHGQDISRITGGDRFLCLPFQGKQLSEPFLYPFVDIIETGIGRNFAGKNPEDGQPAGIGIGQGLKSQGGERGLYGRFFFLLGLGFGILTYSGPPIQRRRQGGC